MPCCGSEARLTGTTFGTASGNIGNPIYVTIAPPSPTQDRLTAELLKILDETESKVTFAVVVETLGERCENWDAVIPAMIRKADRMGWLKVADKDFADKFTENLVEAIMEKAKKPEKTATPLPTPCESHGCTMPCPACPNCPNGTGLRITVPMMDQYEEQCQGGCDIQVLTSPSAGRLPLPHRASEVLPMPHSSKTEVLPMPSESHGDSGCYLLNEYPSDPTERMRVLMNQSEHLRQMEQEWIHFWTVDHPSHLTHERIDGGLK